MSRPHAPPNVSCPQSERARGTRPRPRRGSPTSASRVAIAGAVGGRRAPHDQGFAPGAGRRPERGRSRRCRCFASDATWRIDAQTPRSWTGPRNAGRLCVGGLQPRPRAGGEPSRCGGWGGDRCEHERQHWHRHRERYEQQQQHQRGHGWRGCGDGARCGCGGRCGSARGGHVEPQLRRDDGGRHRGRQERRRLHHRRRHVGTGRV